MPVLELPPEIAPRPTVKPPPFRLCIVDQSSSNPYRARPSAFVLSFVLNIVVLVIVVSSGHWMVTHRQAIRQQVVSLVTDLSPYILQPSATQAGGGGGGGDRDKLAASKGSPPKFQREQITPPAVVVRNEAPKLAVDPSVVGPPNITFPANSIGDPLSNVLGPPSNGTGSGRGIGSRSGGGVGSGRGPGVGPGEGGGIGGGVYKVGGGVSAPKPVFSPDPEYSDQARKAKYQGTVVLWLIVSADGRPRDIRVARSVGMGLDEKAIEAVRTWRFEPAQRDGQPVAVQVHVEVTFHLY